MSKGRVCYITMLALSLSACGQNEKLEKLALLYAASSDPAFVEVGFCTTRAAPIQSNLKYIFVIDNSTSNRTNYQLNYITDPVTGLVRAEPLCPINVTPPAGSGLTTYGTDPTRARRYQALLNFTTTIQNDPVRANDPSRYYSLVEFSTSPRVQRVGGVDFTQNIGSFNTLVQQRFNAVYAPGNGVDEGTTDYLAALDSVRNMIQADIARAKAAAQAQSSAYVVVFISDGFPIPGAGLACVNGAPVYLDSNNNAIQPQSPDQIKQMVRTIISNESETKYVDSITLFTGYMYVNGNEDPGARDLLREMAQVGNGVAYEFGTGQSVDFSLFTLPPRVVRWELGEIFVQNASRVWWNGSPMPLLDSDVDGLPDVYDTGPRFSSTQKDSDGDSLSDLVEFRQASGPSCAGIAPGDTDGDGLSNCEEVYLGNSNGRDSLDTNGNLIPDGLEFQSFMDFRFSPNQSQTDIDLDGVSNVLEVKHGLPPTFSNTQLLNELPYDYRIERTSVAFDHECYNVKVYGVQTLGPNNLIRAQIVEKSPVVVNQYRLRTVEGRFSGSSKTLSLSAGGP